MQNPVDDLFLVASFEDLARLLDDQRLTEAFCFPTRKLKELHLVTIKHPEINIFEWLI